MTLRRYAPIKPSKGTVIPRDVRMAVLRRDDYRCVPKVLGLPHECSPGLELDHVRASGALGKKSRTTVDNLITTCPRGHQEKTLHGREWRPALLSWIEAHPTPEPGDHPHLDGEVPGCATCRELALSRNELARTGP